MYETDLYPNVNYLNIFEDQIAYNWSSVTMYLPPQMYMLYKGRVYVLFILVSLSDRVPGTYLFLEELHIRNRNLI